MVVQITARVRHKSISVSRNNSKQHYIDDRLTNEFTVYDFKGKDELFSSFIL